MAENDDLVDLRRQVKDLVDEYTIKARIFVATSPNHPKAASLATFLNPSIGEELRVVLLFNYLFAQIVTNKDADVIDKAMILVSAVLKRTKYPLLDDIESLDTNLRRFRATLWLQCAQTYEARFRKLAKVEDLEQCIAICRRSRELCSDGSSPDVVRDCFLCKVLSEMFLLVGGSDAALITEAIDYGRRALHSCVPELGEDLRRLCLTNLGIALNRRSLHFKSDQDRENSITLIKNALDLGVELGYPPDALANLRSNLASVIQENLSKHDKDAVTSSLQCIEQLQQAVHDTPWDSPRKAIREYNLACCYIDSYRLYSDRSKLEIGVKLAETLMKSKLSLQERIQVGGAYSVGLYYLHEVLGDNDTLDRCIDACRDNLSLLQENDQLRKDPKATILPYALWKRFRSQNERKDLEELSTLMVQISRYPGMVPQLRLVNLCMSAYVHYYDKRPDLAVEDFEIALFLLPSVLLTGKDYHTEVLIDSTVKNAGSLQLAQHAAIACISCGRYTKAIEMLESGRSIGWSQNIKLRSSFDNLLEEHPEYGKMLQGATDSMLDAEIYEMDSNAGYKKSSGAEVSAWERVFESSQELTRVLKEVRNLEGYESFMLPLRYEELAKVALIGPVVVVNLCKWGSHALLMTASTLDRPQVIPLSDQIWHIAQRRAEELRKGTSDVESRRMLENDLNRRILIPILRDLWDHIVLPVSQVLRCLAPYARRVWWCPTGPLVSLPIHMACERGSDPPYISSYVTTLTSLLRATQTPSNKPDIEIVLAVGCSDVDGYPRLPGVSNEMDILKELIPERILTQLVDDSARTSDVIKQLATSSWIHMSCHGMSGTSNDAYRSYFLLHDGKLHMSDIVRQSSLKAQFAFLSACHTADSPPILEDESMHLAASLSFLGFRGVVATLWAIRDDITPIVISRFYQYIFQRPGRIPSVEDAAEALHLAIQSLKREKVNGKSVLAVNLAPFIHMGI